MKIPAGINLKLTPSEAIALQEKLRGQIILEDRFKKIKLIAGVDCSYDLQSNISRAVVCIFTYPEMELIESVMAHMPTDFPYVPGLLSFREIPILLEAFKILKSEPDLLLVDGMGIAHPRRMGIAAHLGLLLNVPSIGVGKSLLCGRYEMPGLMKGDRSDLIHRKEKIGTVLRTKSNTNPLFISPGHLISHETANRIVLDCMGKFRLPEPTHIADKFSKIRPAKEKMEPIS